MTVAYLWEEAETIWFDDVTRSAYFKPVATVPKHQRRGLGRALLTEGLRRLSAPNKTAAQVGEKAGWLRAMGSSRRSA